jgi:uncharacterized protein
MAKPIEVYLDVETNWGRELTVVGFQSSATGVIQLVGSEITTRRLRKELPREGRLFTYNGHCFDICCIRKQLGIDLHHQFESFDLRWICQRIGLRGGQKLIEQRIGHERKYAEMDGLDAIRLWSDYEDGDQGALALLLCYNAEDLTGLMKIKRHLSVRGLLSN